MSRHLIVNVALAATNLYLANRASKKAEATKDAADKRLYKGCSKVHLVAAGIGIGAAICSWAADRTAE